MQIALADTDIKRAKQIAAYPWFAAKKAWQKEIATMLSNGFKLEVEALISKDISYVTDTYTPERLAEGDWLDWVTRSPGQAERVLRCGWRGGLCSRSPRARDPRARARGLYWASGGSPPMQQ